MHILKIRSLPRFGNDPAFYCAVCTGLLITVTAGCRDDVARSTPSGDVAERAARREQDADTTADDSQPFRIPEINLENIDAAVADAIRGAMQNVRQSRTSADRWGHLGMVLLAHDFRAPAAVCFAHAGELNPNEPRWPLFQARAIRVSQPLHAIPLMEKALALFPNTSARADVLVLRLQLAELLIERDLLDEAAEQIQMVLTLDAENARAHYETGRLAFLKNDFAGCLKHLQRAESLGAIRKQGALLAAEAQRRLGDVKAADEQRARAARLSKSTWPDPFSQQLAKLRTGLKARLVRAEFLYAQQKIDDSIDLLEKTIVDYPESQWARILLARALIRLRRLAEAEQALTDALELSPDSVEAHFRMGVTLQLQQRYREAAKWFEQALQLKPDFAMAHKNLGFCHINLGELDAAVASLYRAVESQPDFTDGWKMLGKAEESRGNVAQARQAYQKALALDPDNHAIRESLRLLDVDATFDPSDLDP